MIEHVQSVRPVKVIIVSVIDDRNVRVVTQPAICNWRVERFDDEDRGSLLGVIERRGHAMGLQQTTLPAGPVIATGHQGKLWHPGILAKYIAMKQLADRERCGCFHLLVDQDVHDTLTVELPVRDGDVLAIERVRLASEMINVPTGSQPAVDGDVVSKNLDKTRKRLGERLLVDVDLIADAFVGTDHCKSLAQQMGTVLSRLMQPYVGELPVMMVSDLCALDEYQRLIVQLANDARRCATCYNQAVANNPQAGVAALIIEPYRVELPLWAVRWQLPRRRVFADLADTKVILTDETGQPIDMSIDKLVPKALLLTAVMRRWCCDLFIHGKGGGLYDQVMKNWWQAWRSEPLGAMAVVSSDINLDFNHVRTGDANEVAHAVWYAHHLKDNIDRELKLDNEMSREKRILLTSMDDDRDKARRLIAFEKIKAINRVLVSEHTQVATAAKQAVMDAKVGVGNKVIADKRDWCFALYPQDKIEQLVNHLGEQVSIARP